MGYFRNSLRWCGEPLIRGETPLPGQPAARRTALRRGLMAVWKERLSRPSAGLAAIAAVGPLFESCLDRRPQASSDASRNRTRLLRQVPPLCGPPEGHGGYGYIWYMVQVYGIWYRCATLGRNTAKSSLRRSVTSRARLWSRLCRPEPVQIWCGMESMASLRRTLSLFLRSSNASKGEGGA